MHHPGTSESVCLAIYPFPSSEEVCWMAWTHCCNISAGSCRSLCLKTFFSSSLRIPMALISSVFPVPLFWSFTSKCILTRMILFDSPSKSEPSFRIFDDFLNPSWRFLASWKSCKQFSSFFSLFQSRNSPGFQRRPFRSNSSITIFFWRHLFIPPLISRFPKSTRVTDPWSPSHSPSVRQSMCFPLVFSSIW